MNKLPSNRVACADHGEFGSVEENGLVVFDGCFDEHSFFDTQAMERLDRYYAHVGPEEFEDILARKELWEMDIGNKWVGITEKYWWEKYTGRIRGRRVLEIGCGVNYITSYLLRSGNDVLSFDICKASIDYQSKLLEQTGVARDRLTVAVANAEQVELPGEFDYVDINNVLHHIYDKRAALERAFRALKPGGQVLIVEPNYFYPLRWIIETDLFDPFNFLKCYFVRNSLMEKDEKAIVFSELRVLLQEVGFEIEVDEKDRNFFGSFVLRLLRDGTWMARLVFWLDQKVFGRVIPRYFAPFEYIVARRSA